jgi:gentisate 1,2-dioxygenase
MASRHRDQLGAPSWKPARAWPSAGHISITEAARISASSVFGVPPWTPYHLKTDGECVLFSYPDRAAQEVLGFWRDEDPSNSAARQ